MKECNIHFYKFRSRKVYHDRDTYFLLRAGRERVVGSIPWIPPNHRFHSWMLFSWDVRALFERRVIPVSSIAARAQFFSSEIKHIYVREMNILYRCIPHGRSQCVLQTVLQTEFVKFLARVETMTITAMTTKLSLRSDHVPSVTPRNHWI
jgi:hypothetical protein